MFKHFTIAALTALLAACSQAADNTGTETNSAANQVAAEKPRPKYCFFKDAETKAWAASRDKAGDVVVSGKAYRSDPRYKAVLGDAAIDGASATISPTIVDNDTGFAAPDNWWEVKATIADSSAVETVTVSCGKKVLATLAVKRSK